MNVRLMQNEKHVSLKLTVRAPLMSQAWRVRSTWVVRVESRDPFCTVLAWSKASYPGVH